MVDMPLNPTKSNHIYLIYMNKSDLASNNHECLRGLKIQPNQIISI